MDKLSIIIPAANEIYLEKTIRDVLEHAEGDIEVIAVLDGYLPDPPIETNDNRVKFIHNPIGIGQRQAINQAAKIAIGKYFMKLDAHCAVDQGFDVKLIADCEYDWTVIPRMYNLNVETWQPKWRKKTDYMYISAPHGDKPFRPQYFEGKAKDNFRRPPKRGDILIDDIMCCMGPGFFMYMDRFWELGGCDENHGSWGQQSVEVSLKAWLSGGRLVVNKKTWFSHWFRKTYNMGYSMSGNDQERARQYSRDLWLNDKWPFATRKLQWVIDKFDPPFWDQEVPIGRWYQEATICGKEMPTQRKKDTSEKRWQSFVQPLLPANDGGRFIELGCNAGFYCRKAVDLGYEVTGVEQDDTYFSHAKYWESKEPKGIKLIKQDLKEFDIPAASILLMANVHYWLTPEELNLLIEKLKQNISQIIIIGRHRWHPTHKSPPDLTTLLQVFKGWEVINIVKGKKHYSVLLDNPLVREVNTKDFFPMQQPAQSRRFYPSFKRFILTGESQEYREYLQWRKFKDSEAIIKLHKELIESIKKEGIKKPFIVEGDKLKDGDHRLIAAEVLGIKKIILKQHKEEDLNAGGWQKYRNQKAFDGTNTLSIQRKNGIELVYYTDNSLNEDIMTLCQNQLLKAVEGKRIISVSQWPIAFGENYCVGELGRSHLSLFQQILAGLKRVESRYVALVEHDCLYTPEHFNWQAPTDDRFFYNVNQWFVDWNTGTYSHYRRKVLSMMIANTELAIKATEDKLTLLEQHYAGPGGCEYGVCDRRESYQQAIKNIGKDLGKQVNNYRAVAFETHLPNVDIRHEGNFSNPKHKGSQMRSELPYWGNFNNFKNIKIKNNDEILFSTA